MSSYERHLQYVMMYITTNEGGGCRINLTRLYLVFRKKDLYLIIMQKLTFHEIWWILWNLVDFIWISWNLVDFRWNPLDFIWISWVKSTRFCMDFKGEIWQISWVKSGRFHRWNLADFERPIARNGKPYVSFTFLLIEVVTSLDFLFQVMILA